MSAAVLLAAYNGQKYIGEQLDSLLAQTVSDFKVFIHDDGSTDGTLGIILDYAARFPDRLCIVEGTSQGGAKENFWFLLKSVEADFYFFCDQDDVWLPEKMEKQIEALNETNNSSMALVFSDMFVCDESLGIISESFWDYIGRDASAFQVCAWCWLA